MEAHIPLDFDESVTYVLEETLQSEKRISCTHFPMVPNADMIRRTDVVWIQTNAISHGYYYKIIDKVRKYDIRLRYFSYASAQKCAEQIVADERAMNQ